MRLKVAKRLAPIPRPTIGRIFVPNPWRRMLDGWENDIVGVSRAMWDIVTPTRKVEDEWMVLPRPNPFDRSSPPGWGGGGS